MNAHGQTDRRIAAAKADLMARLEELQRRLRDAKNRLDVASQIEAHPLIAVGGAFTLGALLGLRRHHRVTPEGTVERGFGATVVAMLGAIAIRLAKDVAANYFSDAARSWFDQRHPTATERAMSRDPNVEPFIEH